MATTTALAQPTLDDDRARLAPSVPTILVIEDDDIFAALLIGEIRDRGHHAVRVATGRDALYACQTLRVDAVVLDLALPDLDGLIVLERLKSALATRHVPIHVVSGHACAPEALRLGAIGFLAKPVDRAALEAVLGRFEQQWRKGGRRVLVIDDDTNSQRAIRELLSSADVTVDVASTGADGLRRLAAERYDCVVLDVKLPDTDGLALLDQLPGEHPPVVVHTACELSEAERARLAAHTRSVVVKGARGPDRLLDAVGLFLHQVEGQLTEQQRVALARIHTADDPLRGSRVLVVDDDMRNLFALTQLLQRHGMEVTKARHGQAALERLDEAEVDLVIMDVMMPVMDGLEAMRRIRAQPRFARLPIIALTAKTLLEDRQACLEAGASDYVTKPMDPANLVALMRVVLFDVRASGRSLPRAS